jgi:hypothetical protein
MSVKRSGPFPPQRLRDLLGREEPLAEAWREGDALVLIGHRDCKTTRETLPYFDRLHRRRGKGHELRLVLQDDVETARTLVSTLKLEVPVRLEPDPYPLAAALGLEAVPTLVLVSPAGEIQKVSEGWNRADFESFAAALGVAGAFFTPEDKAPPQKPG